MTDFSVDDQILNFGMRNLRLETDLQALENSGIEIGHAATLETKEMVDPELFELDIRQSASRMSYYYVLIYCFEVSLRRLIKQTLSEKHGTDWWEANVPEAVRNVVRERQEKEKDSVMTIRSYDEPLVYTTLGELLPIIESNWDDFSDLFRSKKAVKQILVQLNQSRAVAMHCAELHEDEADRMKIMIKDWQRQFT